MRRKKSDEETNQKRKIRQKKRKRREEGEKKRKKMKGTYSLFSGSTKSSAVAEEESITRKTCSNEALTRQFPSHSTILSPGFSPILSAGPVYKT